MKNIWWETLFNFIKNDSIYECMRFSKTFGTWNILRNIGKRLRKPFKETHNIQNLHINYTLGDSWNYMPPILVPSSAKRISTRILVIAKSSGRKDSILRGFFYDIIRPSKELPVQS